MVTLTSLKSASKRGKVYKVCRRGRWFVIPVNKSEKRLKARQA